MTWSPPPALQMQGITKTFGTTIALDGVDLEVRAGEVHALVGENGAGKSTLMKVLSGAIRPDAGVMMLTGKPYRPDGPLAARAAGVAMIYQELTLAPHLSVEANVMLGREQTTAGFLQTAAMRPAVEQALAVLEHAEIAPTDRVGGLSPAACQIVEIARALVSGARVIVLDEPTSSLSRQDTAKLFGVVRRLAGEGVALVYISHFLDEVAAIGERYTVLRDGHTVATGPLAGTPLSTLVEQMVGRRLHEVYPQVPHEPAEVLLEVDRLAGETLPQEASLKIRRGEILGITGLVGAGRTELLRALFGLEPVRSGAIRIGTVGEAGAAPHARLAQGIGLLSEDRKEEGLALGMSVMANLTLSRLEPFRRWGLLRTGALRAAARHWIERLEIRTRGPGQTVSDLSGGNQQKVAIARLLHHDVEILLMDEPTRGVDVGSKVEIYRLMGELAAAGKAVLFVSSYVPELLGVCDSIAVMHRGVLGAARPASELTEEMILTEATGAAH